MLKRSFGLGCALGSLVMATLCPSTSFAFGEPRVVPDTSFYFNNLQFDYYPYATVVKILSADQVIVQIEGDDRLRVIRLAGIQAPSGSDQSFNQDAIAYLKQKIQYRTVKLEGDKLIRNEDATGPVEAYIWLEGEQMNAVLVRSGLSTIARYTHNIKYDNYFSGLQDLAKQEKRGLWSAQ